LKPRRENQEEKPQEGTGKKWEKVGITTGKSKLFSAEEQTRV